MCEGFSHVRAYAFARLVCCCGLFSKLRPAKPFPRCKRRSCLGLPGVPSQQAGLVFFFFFSGFGGLGFRAAGLEIYHAGA